MARRLMELVGSQDLVPHEHAQGVENHLCRWDRQAHEEYATCSGKPP